MNREMTPIEKAIRDFCGHHADWWPSTTQVQEMLALAQPEREPQRPWVGLTDKEVDQFHNWKDCTWSTNELVRHVEATLRIKNT
jgi:hypothetical protein